MIKVNESAKIKIKQLLEDEKMDDSFYLRVGVKGGGCAGLSYILEFSNKEITKDDETFMDNDIKIVCDKKSILYLFGTEIHYSDGLNGKGFEFINPNSSRNCGCGNSFSI
jgi:iron-sulfur cluster assembly protein